MPTPLTEPILIDNGRLHAVYCAPVGPVAACVLLLSPLFEEKRCAHRTLLTSAHALAAAGAAVLMPDLSATGNSAGILAEIGLSRWLDDVRVAAVTLRERAGGPLRLVGCRAGALLAARAVAEGLTVERLLLWQPVTAGRGYLRQLRTRRMIQDSLTGDAPPIGPHEVEGQVLSPALYAELEALGLPDAPPPGGVRLWQCSFTEVPLTEYARLATRWGGAVTLRCTITEPFWNPHAPGCYDALAATLVEEVLA